MKNVLSDPGYAFTQILVNKEGDVSEKVLFLLQMLVPLAFLPKGLAAVLNLLPVASLSYTPVMIYMGMYSGR